MPILQAKCQACHNASTKLGGWEMTSYETIMNTGENGPVIVPGNAQDSLLAKLIQGEGGQMPPGGGMSSADIRSILDWISAGATNN